MGEKGFLSTMAGFLAETLVLQGRLDEAERYVAAGREASAPDDVESQLRWRITSAKTLARRGRLAEAERTAREAVSLAERCDFLLTKGDVHLALADVLRHAGSDSGAREAVAEALALYEQKGAVVCAERARALLRELAA